MDSARVITAVFALSWESWRSQNFSAAELADPEVSGAAANPDGDLLTNWQEFLHGSEPEQPGAPWEMVIDPGGDFLNVIFTRLQSATTGAATILPQLSADLLMWDDRAIEQNRCRDCCWPGL